MSNYYVFTYTERYEAGDIYHYNKLFHNQSDAIEYLEEEADRFKCNYDIVNKDIEIEDGEFLFYYDNGTHFIHLSVTTVQPVETRYEVVQIIRNKDNGAVGHFVEGRFNYLQDAIECRQSSLKELKGVLDSIEEPYTSVGDDTVETKTGTTYTFDIIRKEEK